MTMVNCVTEFLFGSQFSLINKEAYLRRNLITAKQGLHSPGDDLL